jgi:hypothetical protein
MSQNRPPATAARKLLGRAYGVAAFVGAAIVAVTAVFVSRIADSSATSNGTSGGTSSSTQAPGNNAPDGQFDPNQPYYGGNGQLSVPQQNQAPLGGSHGS